jgi:hypothetical protein
VACTQVNPDDLKIAFVTDRPSSDISRLYPGWVASRGKYIFNWKRLEEDSGAVINI